MQRRAGLPDGRVTNRSRQPRSTRSIRSSRRCRRTPLQPECAARQPARVQGRWHRFAPPTRGHPAPLSENDSGAARDLWEALVRRIGRARRSFGPARILRRAVRAGIDIVNRPVATGTRGCIGILDDQREALRFFRRIFPPQRRRQVLALVRAFGIAAPFRNAPLLSLNAIEASFGL